MDYPVIVSGWVIRGSEELPRLYHLNSNITIKLNKKILPYILDCNGENSLEDISRKNAIAFDTVYSFYDQFVKAGAINLIQQVERRDIDCRLGRKEPWLKEVHIDITNNCNLRCRHCFWGENLSQEENLPFEKWKSLVAALCKAGVGRVVISGGEAFTNSDVFRLVKECYDNHIMVASIFTNGTMFNDTAEKVIQFLCENKMETAFYISLDGYQEEQHDFIRGKGNYNKTIGFIRRLLEIRTEKEANYKILINSLIHKRNCTDLVSWYDFLKKLGVDGWRFTTGRVSGFLKKNADEIKISSEECFPEYIRLIRYAIERYKAGEDIYLNVENFFNTRYLRRGKAYLFDENLPICDYKAHACSIDPRGNVQFCTGWQDKKYGNVFETDISDIWYSDNLQNMKSFKISEITECRECKYLMYCGGGCRLECETIYSKDTAVCKSFELFEEQIVPILKENGIVLVTE